MQYLQFPLQFYNQCWFTSVVGAGFVLKASVFPLTHDVYITFENGIYFKMLSVHISVSHPPPLRMLSLN